MKNCPVCDHPYTEEPFCMNCSWELSNDIYWLGDTTVITQQLQQRLEIAKANWGKIKNTNRYQNSAIKYSKIFNKTLRQLKELQENYPELKEELGGIIEGMKGA